MKFTGNFLSKKGFTINIITKRLPYVKHFFVMFGCDFVKACHFQEKFDRNICRVSMGYCWPARLTFL